jgi:peroxiredoxin Q/BCP
MDKRRGRTALGPVTHAEVTSMKVGDNAPDFEAMDEQGRQVRLGDFTGKRPFVLMFYPADNTPGCTKQLCTARDDFDKYEAAGVAVFGVNPGSAAKHKEFSERHGMRTPLLVDDGGRMSRAYDALMPIPLLTLVNRTVVGIDRDGIVRFYQRGMPSTADILAAMAPATASA